MRNKIRLLFIFAFLLFYPFYAQCLESGDGNTRTGWLFASPESVSGGYTSFCQDRDGYLWIGTDCGLIRFDGTSYDVYLSDPNSEGSLSDNRVLGLLCDSAGRLWVATANGLNLYDQQTDSFKVIKLPSLNFDGYIIAITEQSDGIVTFVVSGVGMYGITEENGEPVAFNYLSYIVDAKDFNSLASSESGQLFAGTHDGQLVVISRNGQYNEIKVADNYITGVAIENTGNVIVSDFNDIYRVNIKDYSVTKLSQSQPFQINRLLGGNAREGVYVATSGEGLWAVDPLSDEVFPCSDIYSSFLNLRNAIIGAAYFSPDGYLWLGCNYYGIVMVPVHKQPFVYRKISDVFPDFEGGIKAMATWDGNVLAALGYGRVALFSPEGKLLMQAAVPGGGAICSLTVAWGNKAIIGMANDGLWELSLPDGHLRKLHDISGKYPKILAVPANDGKLVVSVFGKGVMLYDTLTGQEQWFDCDNEKGPLFNTFVESMCRTDDDKVWIGLYGGLACYDLTTDSFITIDQEPFLPGASFDIAPAEDNSILVATSHGLIHLDINKGILRKYTADDGLIDSDVRKIAIDANGGRWIGSQRGLSYQSPVSGDISSYRGGYGLVETSFGQLAFSKDNNLVYLGSNKGITSFNPDSLLQTNLDTCIKVSGMYLNGKKVTPTTRFDNRAIIEGSAVNPTSLYLPYQENSLTLRLATRDFRDASNVQYVWRIDDEGWNTTRRGENLIYLPHLDPGRYKLQIKGVENNVSSELLELSIRISSPWYLTDIAKFFYALVLLSLIALVCILYKKKRDEQENDARIRFFMDISHDIRSPITLIMSPLESLLKQPFDDDVKKKLKLMQRNCQRILSLVNQLLEIRKLEKGKVRLSCRLTDVNRFISELVEMFTPQAVDKGLDIKFAAGHDVPEIWVDRDNFDKILVNLISNAIKYTPKGGSISVMTERVDDQVIGPAVEVSVTDTGVGLDTKMIARIFDRFYRADKYSSDKEGFGIGLDLCRRLVEFHHGTITARNRDGGVKGSIFSVRLPVDSSYYGKDELIKTDDKPLLDADEVSTRIIGATVPEDDRPGKAASKTSLMRRLLVVEDDADLRNYVCEYLSTRFNVTGVENGAEAMKVIGESLPDLVISDVMMPEVDGITLLHRLKSNADTHHIPVILLSSKNAVSDRVAGWEKGADAYLGKPFSINELERLATNLIDNRLRMKGKFSGVQNTGSVIAAPEFKGNDEALMERMMKIINKHIDDKSLNVEKLSQEVGVSRAHLHRKMKDMIGMTPSDFIRTIRLRRACELLRKGDIEVTQVAYTLGFTSQPHFSSVFKKFVGVSPSEYRAKWEAGKAPAMPQSFFPNDDDVAKEENDVKEE